jgi:FO synthase subunit 2
MAGEDIGRRSDGAVPGEGASVNAIMLVADELRRRNVGDVVTCVINRNINFTNVCIKHCGFCAFSRDHREEGGLPADGGRPARAGVGPGSARDLRAGGSPPRWKATTTSS